MPTYQYRCTDCGQSFERHQSFSDDPITVCPLPPAALTDDSSAVNGTNADSAAANGTTPTCGGEVRKIFSNVGISFKGSGFYRNDSRASSSSSSSGSSSSSDSASDSASKAPASSDSSSSPASKDTSSSTVGAASASG